MVNVITLRDIIIEDSFSKIPADKRCPNIRKDDNGPYCTKNLTEGEKINEERRLVCDPYSLQLGCLDKERCQKCIFYQGEPLNRPVN